MYDQTFVPRGAISELNHMHRGRYWLFRARRAALRREVAPTTPPNSASSFDPAAILSGCHNNSRLGVMLHGTALGDVKARETVMVTRLCPAVQPGWYGEAKFSLLPRFTVWQYYWTVRGIPNSIMAGGVS